MDKPLYAQALKESWQMLWEHKILWVFGLFAALLGQAGIGDLIYKFVVLGFNNPSAYFDTFFIPKGIFELVIIIFGLPFTFSRWFALLWLALMLLGLFIFFVIIAFVSQGAIIHAVSQKIKGKSLINFDMAWHKGVGHVGRLFSINLLKKITLLVVNSFVALSLLIVFKSINVWTLSSFVFALIFALVVGMTISFLAVYASGYVVVEEYSFTESLVASWKLFTHHPLVSIEVGFLLLIINFGVMLLGMLALFIFFVVPIAVFWFLAILLGATMLKIVGIIFATIMSVLALMFIGSLLSAFTLSVWTDLFMRMHKEGIKSRLVHFIDKVKY
jgi:hypothetical protein